MGMVMGVTAVILAIAAGIIGLLVWTALIFPRPTARARTALEARPGRCFLSGAAVTLLLGVPVITLLHAPHGLAKMAGWALLLPLAAALVAGLTAMAQLLGERLQTLSPPLTPLGALVRGAVTVELAAIIPFLGWFFFAPLVGLTVTGAGALGCLGRRQVSDEPQRRRGHRADLEIEEAPGGARGAVEPAPIASSLLCVLCASVVHLLR